MTDMTLIPTGGSMGGEAGAAGIGGLIGGGLGALFGRGLGVGGLGVGVDAGGAGVTHLQNTIDTNTILTGVNDLQTAIGNLGMTTIQGQNTTNMTVANAAASTYTGLTAQNTAGMLANVSGFSGVGSAITAGNNAIISALNSNEVNALTRSFEAQIAAAKCCCETNLNIERQANETRGLMRDQFAQSQAVLICDLKAEKQALAFQNSQLQQTAALTNQINQVYQLVNFKLPAPPTPPAV